MPDTEQSDPLVPASGRTWTSADRKALIVWLLVGLVLPSVLLIGLHVFIGMGISSDKLSVAVELRFKGIAAVFVVLGTWIAARLQGRSVGDFGIPSRQAFGLRFWEGSIWGFAMLSFLVFALIATGHFQIHSKALSGRAFWGYAFGWALAFLCVSFSEELTFRGYLLFHASRRMRFWPAAIVSSVGFAAAHIPNPGETIVGILQVLGTGLLFCFMIRRTGNLWFALGYHAAWDWAETFFYGTPDSGLMGVGYFLNTSSQGPAWLTGGSAGPEGSLLSLLILLLAALFIQLRFPEAIYPDRPV